MKRIIYISLIALTFSSCAGRCTADYSAKLKGIKEVCPTCTYVLSEGMNMAIDTAKQPNIVYRVTFCTGLIYPAYKVDHLTKVQ